jgi:transposase
MIRSLSPLPGGGEAVLPLAGARVLVATRPVDFRKGADSLAALVQTELGLQPFSGVIYVFRSKRADRVKLLYWDGTGLCLLSKRLEQGAFRWPSAGQLAALLEGLDWRRVHAVRVRAPQAAA